MPVQSLLSRSTVIGRLRAAGCVFAEDEADLLFAAGLAPSELANAVERRVEGFPLEHILGWAEFCGLRIRVGPGVFVPRRRTELLVREAAALLGAAGAGAAERSPSTTPVVVDLCCGSGAVGAALAALVPGIEVHASDVDPAAVRCARLNVLPVGGLVHEGDLYSALPARLGAQWISLRSMRRTCRQRQSAACPMKPAFTSRECRSTEGTTASTSSAG